MCENILLFLSIVFEAISCTFKIHRLTRAKDHFDFAVSHSFFVISRSPLIPQLQSRMLCWHRLFLFAYILSLFSWRVASGATLGYH